MFAFIMLSLGIILISKKYRERLLKQQALLHQTEMNHREDMLIQQLRSVENERRRISRDIHDELGAVFSLLSVTLAQIQSNEPGTRSYLTHGKELIDSGIHRVRRIAHELIPSELEIFGLAEALKQLCEETAFASGLRVAYTNDAVEETSISKEFQLAVYRIVQELISNSLKHAGAHQIQIHIHATESNFFLDYSDDGKGMTTAQTDGRARHGFNNIETRILLLNGRWEISKNKTHGFACRLIIPLSIPSNT